MFIIKNSGDAKRFGHHHKSLREVLFYKVQRMGANHGGGEDKKRKIMTCRIYLLLCISGFVKGVCCG